MPDNDELDTGEQQKSRGELADEQLGKLTQLEELLDDLANGREVYEYQIREGVEAVETCQDHANEILIRYEKDQGPI